MSLLNSLTRCSTFGRRSALENISKTSYKCSTPTFNSTTSFIGLTAFLQKQSKRSYAVEAESIRPQIPYGIQRLTKAGAIPLVTAIEVLKALSIGQDNAGIELMIEYDRKKFNKDVIGSVILPKPMSQDSKILVFAEGKEAEEALKEGADHVGGMDLIQKVQDNDVEYDVVLSTPAMFPHVVKIARILGPKGLMPTPKKGNVTDDIGEAVKKSKGMFNYRTSSNCWLRMGAAKVNFTTEEIEKNVMALVNSIFEIGAPAVSSGFMKKVYIKSSQGPALLILDAITSANKKYQASLQTDED